MSTALLITSLVVQLLAAVQALRLVRVTGRRSAWVLIATAVLFMAMRRLVTLADVSAGREALDPQAELIALAVSLLMLGGISLIAPLFRSVERSRRELAESEERYAALIRDSPDAIVAVAEDGAIENFNPEATRITGLELEDVQGRTLSQAGFLASEELERLEAELERAHSTRRAGPLELDVRHDAGGSVSVEANLQRVEGRRRRVKIVLRDISARRKAEKEAAALELQLQDARRLEALGQLAGGVAHDFNNLLTVIIGTCEILLSSDRLPDEMRPDLEASCEAAKRAASLTRQLLAFSRRQVLKAETVDLNDAVNGLQELLSRVIGEHIELDIECAAEHGSVWVDRAQLDQVVLNLVTNARDAMPDGGVLTVRTDNVELDAGTAQRRGLQQGRYVALSVIDSGDGMDAETRRRLFEPFFTTKNLGKGAGLGLATVYGIVKQSAGDVDVESAPDQGTKLRVLLPWCAGEEKPPEPKAAVENASRDSGVVLLVEDEPAVREVLRRGLLSAGFKVLVAGNAEQALQQCRGADGQIDAMVSDIVMPGRSGPELARAVGEQFPRIRILLMSGHAAKVLTEHEAPSSATILQKPFSGRQLADRLRELLRDTPRKPEPQP